MREGIGIRRAAAGDAEAIARLSSALGYPATSDEIAQRLMDLAGRDDHVVLVIEREGEIVGWVHVRESRVVVASPSAEIVGLVVEEDARRGGLGGRLVEAGERWAAGRGAERIRVRSNVVRDDAHAFYPALGYERTKTSSTFEKPLRSEG